MPEFESPNDSAQGASHEPESEFSVDGPDAETTISTLREAIIATTAVDLNQQLPNLVENIRSLSAEYPDTIRFRISISFTNSLDPLDYSIEHELVPEDRDMTRTVMRKDPISTSHQYHTIVYPRDPDFSPDALRGALLSSLERQDTNRARSEQPDDKSFLTRIRRYL